MVTLQIQRWYQEKAFWSTAVVWFNPLLFFPLPLFYLSFSVCMCHILTPVCRCGPRHRCRCNLSGPILVLGQIFLHVSACSSRVCVRASVSRGCGLLDRTALVCGWTSKLFSSACLCFAFRLFFSYMITFRCTDITFLDFEGRIGKQLWLQVFLFHSDGFKLIKIFRRSAFTVFSLKWGHGTLIYPSTQ